MQPTDAPELQVAAYDRNAVYALLREWSGRKLAAELGAGRFGGRLTAQETAELLGHLRAWEQRALAEVPLRDGLLADETRGRRVFALLCSALTVARTAAPPELTPGPLPLEAGAPAATSELSTLAARKGLALAIQAAPDQFPYPEDLETLIPPLPARSEREAFEQPTGWRKRLAVLLASGGVILLALPILAGHIPDHPAGLPLALLTLALLIGIKAGWAGYVGSFCIWLVPNLPGFRHGTELHWLLPALPLLAVGVVLLCRDRHIRVMWGWIRERLGR